MSLWLLDTSALLALRDGEAGAGRVADLLKSSALGEQLCYGCFMSLMEVYYREPPRLSWRLLGSSTH